MSLPSGIKTGVLTFGQAVSFTGQSAELVVTITPTHPVVHSASGVTLAPFTETFGTTSGLPGTVALPYTDQDGFIDASGRAFKGWAYTAEGYWKLGGRQITFKRPFQFPTGQNTLDLDLIPEGTISVPVSAPTAVVTSVNGQTGAITLDGSTGGSGGSTADSSVATYITTPASETAVALNGAFVAADEITIDPRKHGYVLGTANDSIAINAAIGLAAAAATSTGKSGVVLMPAGLTTASGIVGKSGVELRFAGGMFGSNLKPPVGSTDKGVIMLPPGVCQGFKVTNVKITGVGNAGQSAVYAAAVPGAPTNSGGWWYGGLEDVKINGDFRGPAIWLRGGSNNTMSPSQFLTFRDVIVSRVNASAEALRITGAVGQVRFEGTNEFDGPGQASTTAVPNIFIGREQNDDGSVKSDYAPYSVTFENTTIQGAKLGVKIERAEVVTFNNPYFEELDGSVLAVTSGEGVYINEANVKNAAGALAGDGTGFGFQATGGSTIYYTARFAGRVDKHSIQDNNSLVVGRIMGAPAVVTSGHTIQRAVSAAGDLNIGGSTSVIVNGSTTPIVSVTSKLFPGDSVTLKALTSSITIAGGSGISLGGNTGPVVIPAGATATLVRLDSTATWVLAGQSLVPTPAPATGGTATATGTEVTFASSTTWSGTHTLGRRPGITVYNAAGEVLDASVTATATTYTVTHSAPLAGSVVLY